MHQRGGEQKATRVSGAAVFFFSFGPKAGVVSFLGQRGTKAWKTAALYAWKEAMNPSPFNAAARVGAMQGWHTSRASALPLHRATMVSIAGGTSAASANSRSRCVLWMHMLAAKQEVE